MDRPLYWIYRTHIFSWRNQPVQAKLIDPEPRKLRDLYGKSGFQDPMQFQPYSSNLELTFRVHNKHPHPDNYFNDAGFQLYSERLVKLLQSFDVSAEVFSVTIFVKGDTKLLEKSYFIYHTLEGVLPAMDDEKSGWTGDPDIGIHTLVLDWTNIESRPLFYCNNIYVPLMRDDVKRAIEKGGFTGFDFINPRSYQIGRNRNLLNF